jgi:hypothetical protein
MRQRPHYTDSYNVAGLSTTRNYYSLHYLLTHDAEVTHFCAVVRLVAICPATLLSIRRAPPSIH